MIEYKVKVDSLGGKRWFLNGSLHRENGPAIESLDGYNAWYINGKLHRLDGPARVWKNLLYHEYYINGCLLTEAEFNRRSDGPVTEDKDDKDDNYTVKIFNDGTIQDRTEWYLNGVLHREDGPAVEYLNGSYAWYKNGQPHREDGPSAKYPDFECWYIDGKSLTKEQFDSIVEINGNKYIPLVSF